MSLTVTLGSTEYTTSYAYDDGSRLDVVTDPLGRAYDFGYDPNGNSTSLAHPNGTLTAYGYDSLNRVRSLTTTVPALGRTIQGYAFTLGAAGNRTRIDEADGTVRDYAYGSLYRLTGERVSEGIGLVYEKSFGYDPVGNRLSQTTTLGPAGSPGPNLQPGTISYGYDGRDRLTLEGAQVYGWDDNGNLLTKDAEATYAWDHENRLVRVQKADGTVVDHVYDADGVRVQTTTTLPGHAPQVTNYLVDTSGSLSHVVVETGGAGALKAYYVRGDDLLAVMRPLVPMPATAADWQTRYMHADGIGSIRRLTDENGQITDGYTYTAFGELLAHTGSDPQPHAFTGEPLDLNSAFQYHRARWYDGRVGRFTGRDPFPGVEEAPATLHRYSYGGNDPVDKVDPTGRFETVATLSVGLSMMNTINAISVPNALAVTPDFMTLHLRSFAPWAVFGTIYKGDNRDFTTSRSKEVTSRIWAYVKFAVRTSRILDRNVGSDPSHQIWPVERVATGTPQMNVTTSGRGLRVDVSGNNPLFPGSADVDIHLNVSANSSGNRTCFSGSMTGDGFPNAEVFVVDRGNRATMIHTYATPADPDTGPYRLLPGDLGRDMGTFANRCH
jgi:RHS repeat-associated protein